MTKSFTRTIKTYTYPVSVISAKNGTPVFTAVDPIISNDELTTKKLNKLASAMYPDSQLYFGKAEVTEVVYELSVKDFMRYAHPVIKEETEKEETESE